MKEVKVKKLEESAGFQIQISTQGFDNSKFIRYGNLLMGSLGIYVENKVDKIILTGFRNNEEDVRRELKGYDILKVERY